MRPLLLLALSLSFGGKKENMDKSVGYIYIQEVFLDCNIYKECEAKMIEASGTATRITWNDEFYWLSAGHVCESTISKNQISVDRSMKIVVLGDQIYTAKDVKFTVYKNDEETDLCLIKADPGPARKISDKKQSPGDRLYTFAFPDGVYYSGMYPFYEGTYNGKESQFHCLTNIPVSPGSSGAGVLNKNGELVGAIAAVSNTFNHRTIYSCENATRLFLSIASEMLKEKISSEKK